jgi:phage terminase large subunit-like protein
MDKAAAVARLRELLAYRQNCGIADCDGQPHGGYPHPHLRGKQQAPRGDWDIWALVTGRGFGKTSAGAEFMIKRVLEFDGPKRANRGIIVAPTAGSARDICVHGESGIIARCPPDRIRRWSSISMELSFTNGGKIRVFGADTLEDADKIRGYQSHTQWFEELAFCRYDQVAWDNGAFANRLGGHPKTIVTTTPRPTKLLKKLLKDPAVIRTGGSLFENAANLPEAYLKKITDKYVGGNLEQSEIYGILTENVVGALLTMDDISVVEAVDPDSLIRVVVGVDPAGTSNRNNAETGIVVVGMDRLLRCYVLEDLSGWHEPEVWAKAVVEACQRWGASPVAEVNFGGALVVGTLRAVDRAVAARTIQVNASTSKVARAEPVAQLYRRREVRHVGHLPEVEQQWTSWIPPGRFEQDAEGDPVPIKPSNYSPDRLDAATWAVSELRGLTGKHVPRARARFQS